MRVIQMEMPGHGKCVIEKSEIDIVLSDVTIMLDEGSPGDELIISVVEMSEQEYENTPEFQGW